MSAMRLTVLCLALVALSLLQLARSFTPSLQRRAPAAATAASPLRAAAPRAEQGQGQGQGQGGGEVQPLGGAERRLVLTASALLAALGGGVAAALAEEGVVGLSAKNKAQFEYQPALAGLDYGKPRTYYPDFTAKPSGLQYKMAVEGTGKSPKVGDRVSVDWEGYTVGYYGRPFQTRNKVKGGAFDSETAELLRWTVGSGTVIAALDEGVRYMKEGGVCQFIVPAELGYPVGDSEHTIVGPKPSTFSGQRALNFVLDNQNLIDKTLLINLRLVKVAGPREQRESE